MLLINLHNIEEIVFRNKALHQKLPVIKPYIDRWLVSKQRPELRVAGKDAVLKLLSLLSHHIEALEEFFGNKVVVDKINVRKSNHFKCNLDELDAEMNALPKNVHLCIHREGDYIHCTYWS